MSEKIDMIKCIRSAFDIKPGTYPRPEYAPEGNVLSASSLHYGNIESDQHIWNTAICENLPSDDTGIEFDNKMSSMLVLTENIDIDNVCFIIIHNHNTWVAASDTHSVAIGIALDRFLKVAPSMKPMIGDVYRVDDISYCTLLLDHSLNSPDGITVMPFIVVDDKLTACGGVNISLPSIDMDNRILESTYEFSHANLTK